MPSRQRGKRFFEGPEVQAAAEPKRSDNIVCGVLGVEQPEEPEALLTEGHTQRAIAWELRQGCSAVGNTLSNGTLDTIRERRDRRRLLKRNT